MRKWLLLFVALLGSEVFAMNHNLPLPWGNPPRCSPPQTPLFAFYNRENTTMMFNKGETITVYCQAGVRSGTGLTWSLHHNRIDMPFLEGKAEALPANLYIIRIPTAKLRRAGFYDLKVQLEGLGHKKLDVFYDARRKKPQSVTPTGICTFGWKAAQMPIVAEKDYRPADFDAFWKKLTDAYKAIPLDAKIEEKEITYDAKAVEKYNVESACLPPCFDPEGIKFNEVVSYKISWAGPDGGRVYAYLARPKADGKYPAMLILPGAGTGPRPRPLDQARHGYVAIDVQVHGLDCDIKEKVSIPGYTDIKPGILKAREVWCNLYLRAWRGVDYLASLPFVDAKRIVTVGGSQGGRLSHIVPSLDSRVAATVPCITNSPNMPHLWWTDRCNNKPRPGFEQSGKATNGEELDPLAPPPLPGTEYEKVMAYIDPLNFVCNLKCPMFANAGLIDPVSPAYSTWSVFLRTASQNKTLVPVAGHGHDWFAEFDRQAYRWLDKVLNNK